MAIYFTVHVARVPSRMSDLVLYQVLGVRPNELTWQAIEQLCQKHRPEDQRLEFKSRFNGASFAKAAAGMANAGGGLLILGIDSVSDRAESTMPLDIEDTLTRVQQSLGERLEPWFRPTYHRVPSQSDPTVGVVIIEVPSSESGPFAVKTKATEGGERVYYVRVERESRHMSEREIEQAYRERFRLQGAIDARLEELVSPVTRMFAPTPDYTTAPFYLAAVPVDQTFRPLDTTRPTMEALRGLLSRPVIGQDVRYEQYRAAFRRVEFDRYGAENRSRRRDGWRAVGVDASWLDVVVSPEERRPDLSKGERVGILLDVSFAARIITSLAHFESVANYAGLTGEVALAMGLLHCRLPTFLMPGPDKDQDLWEEYGYHALEEDVRLQLTISIDQLRTGSELGLFLKQVLDDLASAFGHPGSFVFGQSGQVQERYVSSNYRQAFRQWANRYSVPYEAAP